MSFRGGLQKCIEAAAQRFMITGEQMIAITCNPKGKYYSTSTMPEFIDIMSTGAGPHTRVVFCGTLREFAVFTTRNQLSLNLGDEINDNPDTDPAGQQPDDHDTQP